MALNSAWYLADGDTSMAIVSAVALAVPCVGSALAGAEGTFTIFGTEIARATVGRMIQIGFFGLMAEESGRSLAKDGNRIYRKYKDYKKKPGLDEDTLNDALDIFLDTAGLYYGIKGVRGAVSRPKTNVSATKEGAGEKAEEKLLENKSISSDESLESNDGITEKSQAEKITDAKNTSEKTDTRELTSESAGTEDNGKINTTERNSAKKGNDVLREKNEFEAVNGNQGGDGSRKFKEDCDYHLVHGKKDGNNIGSGRKGVVGNHNYSNFKKVLEDAGFNVDDCIIDIKEHPFSEGIFEIEYRIPACDGSNYNKIIPNQYKHIDYPKTVYDPEIIPDETMIEWGRQAMESGIVEGYRIYGYSDNGLKFQGYIDTETGEVKNYFPVLN